MDHVKVFSSSLAYNTRILSELLKVCDNMFVQRIKSICAASKMESGKIRVVKKNSRSSGPVSGTPVNYSRGNSSLLQHFVDDVVLYFSISKGSRYQNLKNLPLE